MISRTPDLLDGIDTVVRFTSAFDDGDVGLMRELFARDGVWQRADGDVIGRAALETFMTRRGPGILVRHVLSNLRAFATDAGGLLVQSYVSVYLHRFEHDVIRPAPLAGPEMIGRYRDELVREEDRWLLAHRSVIADFRRT